MAEKFNLHWNDFQSNILQTFKRIRKDKDFLNVTLVTEDEVQLEAHKVILSASSPFLENILKKSSHKHPLLFLSGISSYNLNLILDYVYFGEVQVFQEHLQEFLSSARKLKISGLSNMELDEDNVSDSHEEVTKMELEIISEFEAEEQYIDEQKPEPKNKSEKITVARTNQGDTDLRDLNLVISEHMERTSAQLFTCKFCQKTAKDRTNLGKHIETHLDGLCFSCNECKRQFRSRDSLRVHKLKCKIVSKIEIFQE